MKTYKELTEINKEKPIWEQRGLSFEEWCLNPENEPLNEMGISQDKNDSMTFKFNWVSDDHPDCIIDLLKKPIRVNVPGFKNVVVFGYQFRPNVSNNIKNDFRSFLRKISYNDWKTNSDYVQFINRPIFWLQENLIKIRNVRGVFFPDSESNVNRITREIIHSFNRKQTDFLYIPFKKRPLNQVMFDIEDYLKTFKSDESRSDLEKMFRKWIKKMGPRFVIRGIPPIFRPFVYNFLESRSEENVLKSLSGKNVLIYDDIFNTGKTLREIIYQVIDYVEPENIYIYTLVDDRQELRL